MNESVTHFENGQWRVTDHGIEEVGGTYHVPARKLGDAWPNRLPAWPQHMAEKEDWVDDGEFMDAFVFALTVHEGRYVRQFMPQWFRPTTAQLVKIRTKQAAFMCRLAADQMRSGYKFKLYTFRKAAARGVKEAG